MRRICLLALVIGLAVPAPAQIITGLSSRWPDTPPRARLIQLSNPDASGNITVTGAAGSVTGGNAVALLNMDTSNWVVVAAAADGSFRGTLFGPAGSSIMVKAGSTTVSDLQNSFGTLAALPSTILRVPDPPAIGTGVPFTVAGYAHLGGDKHGPGWTIEGTLNGLTFRPGDTVRMLGTLRMVSPLLQTSNPRVRISFGVDRLSEPDGSGTYPRGGFASTTMTPTGIPIELGAPRSSLRIDFQNISKTAPDRLEMPLDLVFQLPSDLPAGFFRPYVFLWFEGFPPSQTNGGEFEFREGVQGPVIRVGDPAAPRIPWMLFVDTFSNGTRGVRAVEDRNRFGLSQRIMTQSETFIVPRNDPATGQPIKFRLEPFAPTISTGDRGDIPLPPLVPFRFPSGSLTVRIQKPDGSTQVIGPAPFVQSRSRSVVDSTGSGFEDNGGHITDCYQLSTMDPRFEVQFSQDGKYVITLEGSIDDVWGNTWTSSGTYEIYIARLLSLDTAVLPGTPFETGDVLNPGLVLTPPVPASVDVRFQLAPNSDARQMVNQTITGTANRFGYFHPTESIALDQPGEYRMDVTASFRDDQGNLWMGSRTWANVVAPRNPLIIAHGARGMSGPELSIGPQWFFARDLPRGEGMLFPFHSGDINWGKLQPPGPILGRPGQPVVTFHDFTGTIASRLTTRTPVASNGPSGSLRDRAAAGQMMLFISRPDDVDFLLDSSKADVWGYSYAAVERPLVRVREETGEELVRGPYWRFNGQYGGQLGLTKVGDLPNQFKFLYGGGVLRGPAFSQPHYAIYGSLWVAVPADDAGGDRTFPPFQGNGGGPSGGPIMTLKDRDIDLFLHLTGVRPGSVLEVGDRFGLSGAVAPPLPAVVSYTVTSPSGRQRTFSNHASTIGYYYRPEDDFTIDEAGMYTVDLNVVYDGQTSAGQVTQPFPSGDVLGSDGGRFFFYAVRRSSLPLNVALPRQSTVSNSAQVSATAPAGVTLNTAHFTTTAPGFLLETSQLSLDGGAVSYRYDPVRLARTFPNLNVNPLADVVTITIFGTGRDANGSPAYSARIVALHGTDLYNLPLPAPATRTTTSESYSIGARGGTSIVSTGEPTAIEAGYAVTRPGSGSNTPAGLAIFGFRSNNVLVTEAGVPASPAILSGRLYAEIDGPVNTGVALINPNAQQASVSFYFTDTSGQNVRTDTVLIPANGKITGFLNEAPFNGGTSFRGTFTFSSSVPLSAIAIRGLTNERSDFLMTTLPVIDIRSTAGSATALFPHFADGGGWTTQIILINPGDTTLAGDLQFRDATGAPASVLIDGQQNSTFSYSIPARTSVNLTTAGAAGALIAGSVLVVPRTNTAAPSGLAIFSYRSAGVTVTEAGVPVSPSATALRLYGETSGSFGATGSIQTGVAIVNNSSSSATVSVELTKLDGTSTGQTARLTIPANGQTAKFLNEIPGLTSLASPFQGLIRVSSSASISVVGLRARYNERGDLLITTTPPVNESAPAASTPLYFPHIVDGGGYTTQFILFPGSGSQTLSGNLQFFGQSGQALQLTVR